MDSQPSSMSDNQRRFFCRIVFLLTCVLPTALVIYFASHQPNAKDWAQLIQSNLPIKVDIASVETPMPNRVVLRGLTVLPSESSMFPELNGFNAVEVNIDYGVSQNEVSFIHSVEIEMDSLASLLKRIIIELDNESLGSDRWQFSFKKVAVVDNHSDGSDLLLQPLSISLQQSLAQDETSPRLHARLLAKIGDMSDSQLAIDFSRYDESNFLSVDARQCELPTNLIRRFLVGAPEMMRSSFFNGKIELETDLANQTHGTVIGELKQVHLDQFKLLGNELKGICDINNMYCNIENGRIQSAQLQVKSSNPITVDRQFIEQVSDFGVWFEEDSLVDQLAISMVELGITIQNGSVFLSGEKKPVLIEGREQVADCIAFKDNNGELKPIAICNSKKSIPLEVAARIISGNVGSQALKYLDHFDTQTR